MDKKTKKEESPERILSALDHVIKFGGFTYKEIAEEIGVTRETVMMWKHNDDIKISRMAEISKICGFTMKIAMCKGSTIIDELYVLVDTVRPLRFVGKALAYYRYSQEEASKVTKLPLGTIQGWLYLEKCTLKDVMKFANALGMSIFITFEMDTTKNASKALGVHQSITGANFDYEY